MSENFKKNNHRKDSRKPEVKEDPDAPELFEKVVKITRCSKVVKGGRRFSFSALVVVGDKNGQVGIGTGKAKEVPDAIKKGVEDAKRSMVEVSLRNNTIPHEVCAKSDGGVVLLKPASPGTGIIAGGGVRAVLEAAGVSDVLSKSLGSNNARAIVNATLRGLQLQRSNSHIRSLKQA